MLEKTIFIFIIKKFEMVIKIENYIINLYPIDINNFDNIYAKKR